MAFDVDAEGEGATWLFPDAPTMSTSEHLEFFACIVLITLLGVAAVKISEWIQQHGLRKHSAEAAPEAQARPPSAKAGTQEEISISPPADFLSSEPVTAQFFQRAAEQPHKVALVVALPRGRRREISYGELAKAVRRLAGQLLGQGIGKGSIVVLALERGAHQVVAVYATMMAHAAWMPVDPAVPEHRFQELVQDSKPSMVLLEEGAAGDELARWSVKFGLRCAVISPDHLELSANALQNMRSPRLKEEDINTLDELPEQPLPAMPPSMDSQALLIYTSGTTGKPKGIVYSHAMINHGVGAIAHLMEMTEESVAFLKTPAIWAVAEWELFPALTKGATLVVGTPSGHKDPRYMADTIRKEGVTCLVMAPDVLDLLLDIHEVGGQLEGLKHVISVGAGMPVALANRFTSAGRLTAQLHNVYGASESSCTVFTVPKEGVDRSLWPSRAPVGVPQPGCNVWLLDAHRKRVPTGEAGEVCFGGQLAVGYWNKPDLTTEKFVVHPEFGRIYCSGDVARWQAGVLEVCGRKDRQVKIRGVRVEPEEVENALRTFRLPARDPAPVHKTRAAATSLTQVGCVATSGSSPDLVAFVAPDIGDDGVKMVQDHLAATLSAYYVPKYVFARAELPKLANGKVDVKELAREADKLVGEGSAQVVMDSLGRMRHMSKAMMLETQVVHRCYAYWMLGVLSDHWNACGLMQFTPYCMVGNQPGIVPKWVELFLRQLGNDQNMFGFIFLGALQDSRLQPGETKIKFRMGYATLFCFLIYLLAGFPLPQLLYLIFGDDLVSHTCDSNWVEVSCSGHRWYLFMIVWTHLCMLFCQLLHVPGWAQTLGHFALALFGPQHWYDVCEHAGVPTWLKWVVGWVVPYASTWTDALTHEAVYHCPVMYDWLQWYVAFYVFAFYHSRPVMEAVVPVIERAGLNTASWAVVAFGTSILLGSLQAAFHYPNIIMEFGVRNPKFTWTDVPLEFGVNMLQPILVALSMAWLPFDLSWWGNTTLGTYLFHFYFLGFTTKQLLAATKWVHSWAAPMQGLPQLVVILAVPIIFMSTLGPAFHYLLLSPSIIYRKVGEWSQHLREARAVRDAKRS